MMFARTVSGRDRTLGNQISKEMECSLSRILGAIISEKLVCSISNLRSGWR